MPKLQCAPLLHDKHMTIQAREKNSEMQVPAVTVYPPCCQFCAPHRLYQGDTAKPATT